MDSNEHLRTERCVPWGERWQMRFDDLGDYLCFYGSWVRCKIAQDVNGGTVSSYKFPHQSRHQLSYF